MSIPVARKLSDEGAFAWSVFWTILVAGVLGYLCVIGNPFARPLSAVMLLAGVLLSSFLSRPISRVDATLVLGAGPAIFFLTYNSLTPASALALWGTGYLVGALIQLRHVGDAAETSAYGIGCVLVCTLALQNLPPGNAYTWAAGSVCVAVFVVTRLLISFIRLSVVASISVRNAFRALLARRIIVFSIGLAGIATLGHALQQLIEVSTPTISSGGAGAVVVLLVGAATFAFGMFQESHRLSIRLRGSLEAALSLPWDPGIPIQEHARSFAQRILPRNTVELRAEAQRNINEITAPIGDQFLIARRGAGQAPFLVQDQQVLDAITHLATTMAAARSEHERLARAAATDDLTGLPNFRGFRETLEQLDLEEAERLAIAYVDVDDFKRINDTYGHEVGNTVLRTLAERMGAELPGTDFVARVGGDEFVIILHRCDDEDAGHSRLEELFSAVSTPVIVGDRMIEISLSYGLAFSDPEDHDISALIATADARMYAGRQRHGVGGGGEGAAIDLAASVARIVEERAVTFVYQPIIDAASNTIVGLEALVRPAAGESQEITADRIVNEARRLGCLTELSIHMLTTTMAEMTGLQRIAPELSGLHVNIDVEQSVEPEFLALLNKELRPPGIAITLELGEMSLHRVSERITAELQRLRTEQGVSIALDDFGTNSSTLRAIADYPLDVLKVDKSMISNICDRTTWLIMKSLAGLCADLPVKMVVEGVEDEQTRAELVRAGVRYMQGYLFSAPLTAEQLVERIRSHGLAARVE